MILVNLEEQGPRVRIQVRESGRASPVSGVRFVSTALLEQFARDWQTLYARAEAVLAQGGAPAEIEHRIRRKGKVLAFLLFGRYLPEPVNGPLVISAGRGFWRIPFELLYSRGQFLSERMPILREIIIEDNDALPQNRSEHEASSALLLFDGSYSGGVAESVVRERDALLPLFRARKDLTTRVVQTRPEPTVLLENLVEARYLHYSGHNDPDAPIESGFVEPGLLNVDLRGIRVAFLNACHSAVTRSDQRTLAEAFIRSGVRNFVGFGLPVETKRAEFAARLFWTEVLKGTEPMAAVQKVRQHIREQFGICSVEWISLQHFGTVAAAKRASRGRLAASAAALLGISVLVFGALQFPGRQAETPRPEERRSEEPRSSAPETAPIPRRSEPAVKPSAPPPAEPNALPGELESLFHAYPAARANDALREQILKFYGSPHPVYDERRKLDIIRDTLNLDTNDAMKIVRLKSEMGRP